MRSVTSFCAALLLFIAAPFCAADEHDPAPTTQKAAGLTELAAANNAFAFDLYTQLIKDEKNASGNVFFSPYSISLALEMAAEGARGETATQMGTVLRYPAAWRSADTTLPWKPESIHAGVNALAQRFASQHATPELLAKIEAASRALAAGKAITRAMGEGGWGDPEPTDPGYKPQAEKNLKLATELEALKALTPGYELAIANAIFGDKSYPFEKPYLDSLASNFSTGGLKQLDFQGEPIAAIGQINDWIAHQTRGKIKEVCRPDAFKPLTRLMLVNAVYFRGAWADPFDPERTLRTEFLTEDGKGRANMMCGDGLGSASYAAFNEDGSCFESPAYGGDKEVEELPKYFYPAGRGFQLVELPYKESELAMTLIVPLAADGLADIEKKLTASTVKGWTDRLVSRSATVAMPRFSMASGYKLKSALSAMGMPSAFDERAQFGGIGAVPLKIDEVWHDTFLAVDEKGTEAAAATRESGAIFSASPFVPEVRADRPFIFMIRDRQTGAILFLGRVMKPSKFASGLPVPLTPTAKSKP